MVASIGIKQSNKVKKIDYVCPQTAFTMCLSVFLYSSSWVQGLFFPSYLESTQVIVDITTP